MPTLTIQERGSDRSWTHECSEDVVSIGRLDTNIIQLHSEGVSRQHAKIILDGENFFLLDLKSGNGTQLNGIQLKAGEKNLLKAGDQIAIDVFDLFFHTSDGALKDAMDEEVTESDILEVKLLKKVLGALDKDTVPSIEVLNGAAEGKKIFFTDDMSELVIGRDPDCDFAVNEYVISRRHARVIKRWGGIAIRDLESKNGTFVNNRRVVEEYLHDGDRVALGTIVFLFRNPQEVNLATFEDIKPKHRPAPVKPHEIPGLEDTGGAIPQEPAPPPEQAEGAEAEELPPLEEWDQLEKSLSGIAQYPVPEAKVEAIKKLTPIEIGMIGLGTVVILFALITVVNLLAG